jgi:hypothetical protein
MGRFEAQPRLPLEPLMRLSGAYASLREVATTQFASERGRTITHNPVTALAALCGVERRTIHRWQHDGIPLYHADEAAVACGHHPALVWGEDWHRAGLEASELEAQYPGAA